MLEGAEAFALGPFLGGRFAELHQAEFLGAPADVGMEVAFAPDDGLDEGGINAVVEGGGANGSVLAAFEPGLIPPKGAQASRQQQQQEQARWHSAPLHPALLPHRARCVQPGTL